jgi:hypothetical protein
LKSRFQTHFSLELGELNFDRSCGIVFTFGAATDLSQFDFNSISDVILHLKYTARAAEENNDDAFKTAVIGNLGSVIGGTAVSGFPSSILLDVRHEYASEWYKFISGTESNTQLNLSISKDRFPFFAANRTIDITMVQMLPKKDGPAEITEIPVDTITKVGSDFTFSLSMSNTEANTLQELFLVLTYKLSD